MKKYGLDRFADISYQMDGDFAYAKGKICPAFLLQTLASVIAINNEEGMYPAFYFILNYSNSVSKSYRELLAGFVMVAAGDGMRHSHAPSTYILLTQKL